MTLPRVRLAEDLDYEKVRSALEDAMDSTKQARAYCPKCKEKVYAEFPDHSARIRAVELWLEQGFGKPGTTSAAPVVPDMSRPFEEMRTRSWRQSLRRLATILIRTM